VDRLFVDANQHSPCQYSVAGVGFEMCCVLWTDCLRTQINISVSAVSVFVYY